MDLHGVINKLLGQLGDNRNIGVAFIIFWELLC